MPHQRTALEALTPNRNAASRQDDPDATAASTLSRKSTDNAFGMPLSAPSPTGNLNQMPLASGNPNRLIQLGNHPGAKIAGTIGAEG